MKINKLKLTISKYTQVWSVIKSNSLAVNILGSRDILTLPCSTCHLLLTEICIFCSTSKYYRISFSENSCTWNTSPTIWIFHIIRTRMTVNHKLKCVDFPISVSCRLHKQSSVLCLNIRIHCSLYCCVMKSLATVIWHDSPHTALYICDLLHCIECKSLPMSEWHFVCCFDSKLFFGSHHLMMASWNLEFAIKTLYK